MLNIRPYNNKEQLLFPPSVGDYLDKNHLANVVDEAVGSIDLTPYYRKISPVGNPAYDPALMLKIWFYGYATRTYSSRRIEDRVKSDVAFIYLAGMQKPDFRTISDFRKNNLNELKKSFVDILQICERLGMTQLGNISIDSKVMKANAAASRTYTDEERTCEEQELEKAIQEYLQKANQIDDEEDKKYGSDKCGNELPEDIRNKEERIKKMKQIVEELKQAREKLKETDKKKINLTDSDAQFQKGTGKIILGYRGHIAVDSKEHVIVANDVTNEANDSVELIPMVKKVLENVKEIAPEKFSAHNTEKEKINISADTGYSSGRNFAELEKEEYKNKIEPFIPDKKGSGGSYKENPQFDKSKFIYNSKDNTITCPAGIKLYHIGKSDCRGVMYDNYGNVRECKKCQHYGKCTKSKSGRLIAISQHQPLIAQMRQKLSNEEGKKIYGLRKITAEPVFGNISHNLGFREFLLRGVEKVRGEFSLMCTAHNILKIARVVRSLGACLKELLSQSPPYQLRRYEPALNTS